MLYWEYANGAKKIAVKQHEETGVWYLDPDWKFYLIQYGYGESARKDATTIESWDDVKDMLMLEVEMRNATMGKQAQVINYFYNKIPKDKDEEDDDGYDAYEEYEREFVDPSTFSNLPNYDL